MSTQAAWTPLEGRMESPDPLAALAAGDVPAIVLRGAYPQATCRKLVERLIDRDLLYDPTRPVPEKFVRDSIPEGHYFEGLDEAAKKAWSGDAPADARRRIDVGTSLGYRGADPEGFFAHAAETRRLFADLFEGMETPIDLLYGKLSDLAGGKRVVTAREPDGRLYGPAIIRAHYGSYTYKPHFDSVRLREKRETYAVYRFQHQFAGVLVLQNAERGGESAQCTVHRYLWQPEVQPYLDAGTFAQFAESRGIESCRVVLEPGDLYFFNTRAIHEVPGVDGDLPRIVLATFVGYSAADDEIFVWS